MKTKCYWDKNNPVGFWIFIQKPLKFTGRFHLVRELFHDLPCDVVYHIWASGFCRFIDALPTKRGRSYHYSLFALIERWMDTTHTFYARVGELTISPMSFSAITGNAFGDTPVPFDVSYCYLFEGARGQYIRDLLGFLPTWKNRKNVVLVGIYRIKAQRK